jgi:hypothetical protein
MRYRPLVPAAHPPLDSATLDAVALLARLLNLVSLSVAHLHSHPAGYKNASGRLLRDQIIAEARSIFGRAPRAEELDADTPDESTV